MLAISAAPSLSGGGGTLQNVDIEHLSSQPYDRAKQPRVIVTKVSVRQIQVARGEFVLCVNHPCHALISLLSEPFAGRKQVVALQDTCSNLIFGAGANGKQGPS